VVELGRVMTDEQRLYRKLLALCRKHEDNAAVMTALCGVMTTRIALNTTSFAEAECVIERIGTGLRQMLADAPPKWWQNSK
jgi:hypothetical protein